MARSPRYTKKTFRTGRTVKRALTKGGSRRIAVKTPLPMVMFDKITVSNSPDWFKTNLDFFLACAANSTKSMSSINLSAKTNFKIYLLKINDKEIDKQLSSLISDKSAFISFLNSNRKQVEMSVMSPQYKTIVQDGKLNPDIKKGEDGNNKVKFLYPFSKNFDKTFTGNPKGPQTLSLMAFCVFDSQRGLNANSMGDILYQKVLSDNTLVPAANIIDYRQKNFDDYLDFNIINQTRNLNESYFSDAFTSYDKEDFAKFIFFWDKIQFLIEKSVFGNILVNGSVESVKDQIIKDSQISQIKVFRKRVKKTLNFATSFSKFSPNEVEEVIVTSSDDVDGDLLKNTTTNANAKPTSAIAELKAIKGAGTYRIFAVNDYYSKKINYGWYQYGVYIRIEDGILKYLIQSLSTLENSEKTLDTYYNKLSQPKNFHKPKISSDLQRALGAMNDILTVLFSLRNYSTSAQQRMIDEFTTFLNSPSGTMRLISFCRQLFTKIFSAIGTTGIPSRNSSKKSKVYSKLNNDLFFLEARQWFNNYCDFSALKNIDYDYFNLDDQLSFGAGGYTLDDIENRFFGEFKKLMVYDGDRQDIDFGVMSDQLYSENSISSKQQDLKANMFDMQRNYYSFLSPIKAGDLDISSESRDIWENEPYNDMEFMKNQPYSDADIAVGYQLQKLGVAIEEPIRTSPVNLKKIDSDDIVLTPAVSSMGEDNKIEEFCIAAQQKDNSAELLKEYKQTIVDSKPLANAIYKFYNNTNLVRSNFDLESPANLLDKKRSLPDFDIQLRQIPNHTRALFASRSDLTRNQWASMENDFLSDCNTINMMKENFSNLIRIEVLTDFEKDADGKKLTQLPIFKNFEIADIEGLRPNEFLFCRTYKYEDLSLGIGLENTKNMSKNNYYNKYFIITGGTPESLSLVFV